MDGNTATVLAGLAGVIVTAVFGYITQRAAARAAVRNAELTSRTDLEKEAFERAQRYYTAVIEDQNKRITARDTEITDLRTTVHGLEAKVEEQADQIEDLQTELEAAKKVLRLRYPDE